MPGTSLLMVQHRGALRHKIPVPESSHVLGLCINALTIKAIRERRLESGPCITRGFILQRRFWAKRAVWSRNNVQFARLLATALSALVCKLHVFLYMWYTESCFSITPSLKFSNFQIDPHGRVFVI